MLMLGCRGINSSPALSPTPVNMTDLLEPECYGWENNFNEALSSVKQDSPQHQFMEFLDSSNSTNNSTVMIAQTSSCSSSPSSSPSSIILQDPLQNQSNEMLTQMSSEHYLHSQQGMSHTQSQQQVNNHEASNNNQGPYSHYMTPLSALMMNTDQNPYSPTDGQMISSFTCLDMDGTDFHKMNESFGDSYDNFLSEDPHQQLHTIQGINLNSNHHQHQSLENDQQQVHHQNQQQQHQQGIVPQNTGPSNQILGLQSNNHFQFNEPSLSLGLNQSHHHQHVTSIGTFQQYRGSEFNNNTWEEPSYYGGEYKFSCKGESPATSDSVSYKSVDSGVGSSKSSTESISASTLGEGQNKLVPPKRRVGRPPKKDKKQKKLEKKTGRLWEFIRDLLKNPEYCPSLVRWENPEEGHFRFVNSDQVAKLWGRLKGNPRMTYEKLSRAMRYYYKSKVFEPVLGRRLVYKFGFNATNWRPTNPNFSQKMFC